MSAAAELAARVAVVVAVVSAVVVAGVGPADARFTRRATLVCGELPTTDVVLRRDLTCPTGFHFAPGTTPVEIDLGGHTLTVPGDAGACTAPGPCGAIAGATAVRNGAVVGTLSDVGSVSRVIVRGDVLLGLGFAGAGGPASLRSSFVLGGDVQIWGPSIAVDRNLVLGGIALVSTNTAIRDVAVTRNWVAQSPQAGISVRPPFGSFPDDVDGTISENVVWGATGPGILVTDGIDNVGALEVRGNLLVGNGGSGFRSGSDGPGPPAVSGGPITLTGNIALFNHEHGIEAAWRDGVDGTGVVDGGGNRAAFDGAAPECIGVVCPTS